MTTEELGRLSATVLVFIVCLDRFYFLPKKIKRAEALTDSGARMELERLQRRLASYKRFGWVYIALVGAILNVILLAMKFMGE